MAGTLLYEIRMDAGSDWFTADPLNSGDPPGSISDITGGVRSILLFRCDGDRSVISRSVGAVDFDIGLERVVMPPGELEILAKLGDGESYERDIISDSYRKYRARWTHRG